MAKYPDDIEVMIQELVRYKLTIWRDYFPHEKQQLFDSYQNFFRLICGGNRSGKTRHGAQEAIRWSLREHPMPYWQSQIDSINGIVRGRIVAPADAVTGQIIPYLQQLLPPERHTADKAGKDYLSEWKIFDEKHRQTGWFDIKTHGMDPLTFSSVELHWEWFDEPPPYAIWREMMGRLASAGRGVWVTMTPLLFAGWMLDEVIHNEEMDVDVVWCDMDDNPHLNEDSKRNALSTMDADELIARKTGRFISLAGTVFKHWNRAVHVIENAEYDELVPGDRPPIYCIMDPHDRKPPAVIWIVRTPTGAITVANYPREAWNKIRSFDGGPEAVSEAIWEIEEELELPHDRVLRFMDPKFGVQTKANSSETIQSWYNRVGRERKMNWMLPDVKDVTVRHAAIRDALGEAWMGYPKLRVMKRAENVIRAFERYIYIEPKQVGAPISQRVDETWKDFIDCEGYYYILGERSRYSTGLEVEPMPQHRKTLIQRSLYR